MTDEIDIDLDQFQATPDDHGLSLEQLSDSFARLLGQGDVPYESPDEPNEDADPARLFIDEPSESVDVDENCLVSPRSILEAILFVGHPQNQPITSRYIASLMRGVRAVEIDQLVKDLNAIYDEESCAYFIESLATGYCMRLRDEMEATRQRFYGRVKEARLSQAAINVLSVIAYQQPLTKKELGAVCDEKYSRMLAQLIRRGLVAAEKRGTGTEGTVYRTTARFLSMFGLESVDDLPQAQSRRKSAK